MRWLDVLIGFIVLSMVCCVPWLLGATTKGVILALISLGYICGVMWFIRIIIANRFDWDLFASVFWRGEPLCIKCVKGGVLFILFYVLISVLNARGVLEYGFSDYSEHAAFVEVEYRNHVDWLPSSYGLNQSFFAFCKYLSIAIMFFVARSWLLDQGDCWKDCKNKFSAFPTFRVQLFIWVIALSGGALSLVGILQRLDKTEKLLWLFDNHLNKGRAAFGPFPYQSNAAQYLNLAWPIVFGYWLILVAGPRKNRLNSSRIGSGPEVMLLVSAVLIFVGVPVTSSRGGVIVMLGIVFIMFAMFCFLWKPNFLRVSSSGFFLGLIILLCIWLGGESLWLRFRREGISGMSGRDLIYSDASRMVHDFSFYGSGAETFAPLYYFYREKNFNWDAYAHNDYLETLITFGWVGIVICGFTFISICSVPFFGNGIPVAREFIIVIALAMAGMLIHARFDLPFQIYSLHFEFAMLCSLLTCLKWKKE